MPHQKKQNPFLNPVVFSFLGIISAIEFIRMSLMLTLLPSFLLNLHYSRVQLGMVISANLLTDNLFKSGAGWLVDHKGPWPVLISGSLIVFSGVLLIVNFHSNFWLVLLAVILIGFGVAPTWPAAIAGSIQTVGEEKRATAISVISVVWLAGGGLGPILMGFLIEPKFRHLLKKINLNIFYAYRTCFLILLAIAVWAVIVSLVGYFSWRALENKRKLDGGAHVSGAAAPDPTQTGWERLKAAAARLWHVKGLIPGMFVQTLAMGMLIPNMVPYATQVLGFSESQYSLLLLVGGAVAVIPMVFVGHISDRIGSKGFLVAGFFLAAAALFALISYGNRANILIFVGAVGLSYAFIQPAWNALLAGAIPPQQRGVLMGLFMSVEGLGFAVGPLLGGLLVTFSKRYGLTESMGTAVPFYVSSVLLVIMAFVYLVYPFQRYRLEEG